MAGPSLAQIIAQGARQRGLDPAAVLSIASVEGGVNGGQVGDNGTSFGPFQLHMGGALPAQFNGNPTAANAFANSPAGIAYAENAIQKVAGGKHGKDAIAAISSGFERPADVAGEVAKASSRYGQFGNLSNLGSLGPQPKVTPASLGTPAPAATGNPFLSEALQLLQNGSKPNPLMALAQQRLQFTQAAQKFGPQPSPTAQLKPLPGPPGSGGTPRPGGILPFVGSTTQGENSGFLNKVSAAARAAGATQIRVTSGRRSSSHNAAVGGVQNSNHLTGHALDGEGYVPGHGWVPLGTLLKGVAPKFGLRSGDQPGFFNGGPDTVHVDDGFNVGGVA